MQVKKLLEAKGITVQLVPVKSEGDIDLVTPLYAWGVQGIFTRSLDAALLAGKVDIAVHSMKDVPVVLAKGLVQAAVLPRGYWQEVLVPGNGLTFLQNSSEKAIIATSSLRRKAQWLRQYPHHQIVPLRGNIDTRLQKIKEHGWHGAIFAKAGLTRLGLLPPDAAELDWMLPAPAQGAIMVVCRQSDKAVLAACASLNDAETALSVKIERDFLHSLKAGCTAPISALVQVTDKYLHFRGQVLMPDGSACIEVEKTVETDAANNLGEQMATECLAKGAAAILAEIRKNT
jgi:hydroxymethylbilane synthase